MKVRQGGRELGTRVRVRPWGDEPGVVQLVLADQGIVPDANDVPTWVDAITAGGLSALDGTAPVTRIRTGALFPEAAARFAAAGFAVIDTLALLQLDLTGPPDRAEPDETGPGRTASLRARHHDRAARIDRAAFGGSWANDRDDLVEIRRATPLHVARGRFVGRGLERTLVAFAITGAASGQGYLQRLAVDPAHQRAGHGRALTLDSIAWMRRRNLTTALVNTAVDNASALALYTAVGFRSLPDRLQVMQLVVAPR